jgi:hypothetical protein
MDLERSFRGGERFIKESAHKKLRSMTNDKKQAVPLTFFK